MGNEGGPSTAGGMVPDWLGAIAAVHASECGPECLGTVRYIDPVARIRGARCVQTGHALPLGRLVSNGVLPRYDDERDSFALEVHSFVDDAGILIGTDRVVYDAHGLANTHLDGPAHIGLAGTWHGGIPTESHKAESRKAESHKAESRNADLRNDNSRKEASRGAIDGTLVRWARCGLVTRAALIDIPSARGTPWVELGQPVTGDELDRYLATHGIELLPGDAILLYMGRDAYEVEGRVLLPSGLMPEGRPGIDRSGAIWLADHRIGILCWDFLDALGFGAHGMSVHMLIWAIGLALVDNCDLGPAARAMADAGRVTAMLSVAPLPIPGATGSLVNPILVL